jgi:lysophospholipase L1-like esterase
MTFPSPPGAPPRRRRVWRYRLTALAVSLLLGLGGAELLVRLVAPQRLNGRFSEMTEKGLLVNRANWRAQHGLGPIEVEYRFNEHHLRGGPIGAGKRVLVLGDSFTFGWLLDEPDTYVHQLGERCEREFGPGTITVLNGGRGGWGAAEYLAFLEDHGGAIRPDMVVVFVNFADIQRSVCQNHYRLAGGNPPEAARVARTRSLSRSLTDHCPVIDWLLAHSHLYHLSQNALAAFRHGSAQPAQKAQTASPTLSTPSAPAAAGEPSADALLGEALFRRMHGWCREKGIPLVVLTTGYQSLYPNPHDAAFLREAPDFFAREGIPFHDPGPDVTAAVQGHWAPYLIPVDGHPNAAGARLIAGPAWEYLAPFFHGLAARGAG